MMETKKCSDCGIDKELKDFYNSQSDSHPCKICHRKTMKTHSTLIGNPNRIKKASKNYPAPEKAIYAIFIGTELVYVGESKNTPERLYEHFNRTKGGCMEWLTKEERNFTHSYKILWDGTDFSKKDRCEKEMILIHILKPKYNKQWNQED